APEGISVLGRESCALLYGSCKTGSTPELWQPYRLPDRNWMMWDGRLDNRGDLRRASIGLEAASTDVEIIASVYQRFETRMFSQLIGDWAISIFSEARQEVIL